MAQAFFVQPRSSANDASAKGLAPMTSHQLGYRPCVGIMLFNQVGQVWTGRRLDAPDDIEGPGTWWQMPQGGIDESEDPAKAALRELYEETGVRSARIIGESPTWHTYDFPPGVQHSGRYRGQRQKWFAARFLGSDAEVELEPPGHKAEFGSWRWAGLDELLDLVVPFKRDVYAQVIRDFAGLAVPDR